MKSYWTILLVTILASGGLLEEVQAKEPFFKNTIETHKAGMRLMEKGTEIFLVPEAFPFAQVFGGFAFGVGIGVETIGIPIAAVTDLVASPTRGKGPSESKNRKNRRRSGR